MKFLVTTDKNLIPQDQPIVMVDGSVPGWEPQHGDFHVDHHRTNGPDIQLYDLGINYQHNNDVEDCCFVTTLLDADACVAAAWIILSDINFLKDNYGSEIVDNFTDGSRDEAWLKFSAIAYDCDHLCLPADSQWDGLREFAANCVAAMKLSGEALAKELDLSANRKEWSEAQKLNYASIGFERGVKSLVNAALGLTPYPGELGEAKEYFDKLEELRPQVYQHCYLYKGCAVFDQRSFNSYVDPRLVTDWARANATNPVTLTVRDGSRQPNAELIKLSTGEIITKGKYRELVEKETEMGYQAPGIDESVNLIDSGTLYSYTLGSIPLHLKGCPNYSDNHVWQALAALENSVRATKNLPSAETQWGGRNAVGGSSWRDPALATPEMVIDCVLATLDSINQ